MNFRAATSRRRRRDVWLDLTPMIDVVFLLLIFFLITTTFVRRTEMVVTINLPEGSDQPVPQDDERLTIYVDVGGNFTLTQGVDPDTSLSLDQEQLERELSTYYETDPNLAVFLRGDQDVNYGSVIDVLLMARRIGFQKVQAVIREADGP